MSFLINAITGIAQKLFGSVLSQTFQDIFFGVVGAILGIITGLINTLIGLAVWLVFQVSTWLINIALLTNSRIADSTIIKFGFDTVLDIANLAIIVAIVAIAFMVMLRRGNAANLLIRFVIVAVFINFGFLITTHFFIEPVDSVSGALNTAINDVNPATFGTAFVPEFNFGALFSESTASGTDVYAPPSYLTDTATNTFADTLPGWSYTTLLDFSSILFSVAFLIIGTIALFSFAGMLFVRYVYLGILIILMPIAWVSWIFPNLHMPGGHPFKEWWENFIKWLLFGPVAMFFFWLSVKAVNLPEGAISISADDFAGSGWSPALAQAASVIGDEIIVIGLMIGGLIVANKMGITGSKAAMAGVKKFGDWAKKRGRDYAIRGVSSPLRSEKGKERLQKLQNSNSRSLNLVGRGLDTLGAKAEDRISKVAQEQTKALAASPERAGRVAANMSGPKLVALLQKLDKGGNLDKIPNLAELIKSERVEKTLKQNGQGQVYSNMEKSLGANRATLLAADRAAQSGSAADVLAVKEEMKKFRQSFKKDDYKKIGKTLMGGTYDVKKNMGLSEKQHRLLSDASIEVTVDTQPGAFAQTMPKLKASEVDATWNKVRQRVDLLRDQFDNTYKAAAGEQNMDDKMRVVRGGLDTSVARDRAFLEDAERRAAVIKEAESNMKRARRNLYFDAAAPEAPTPSGEEGTT